MSSGAKVVSHIIKEVTPGVTPVGTWDTLRLTGNALTPTVNTEVSDEITESRVSQGSVATSVDIAGDLAAEFSYGSFDELLEAAFYGAWTSNVLTVGDVRHTFSIAKGYTDVGVYSLFKGAHVSTFALDIPADGKGTAPCLPGHGVGTRLVDVEDDNLGPLTGVNPRDLRAETGSATCHQGNFVTQTHVISLLRRRERVPACVSTKMDRDSRRRPCRAPA